MRVSPNRALVLAFLCLASVLSCRGQLVTAFQWRDASGAALSFRQLPPGEGGVAGRLTQTQRTILLRLDEVKGLQAGSAIEIEIERGKGSSPDTRASLSLSERGDGTSPFDSAIFPLLYEVQRFAFPIEAGSRIAAIAIKAEGSNPAFELRSIKTAPYVKGIERLGSEPYVTAGFSLARGRGIQILSIVRPFAVIGDDKRAGIVLQYGMVPVDANFELEAKLPGGERRAYVLRSHPKGIRTILDASMIPLETESLTLRLPEAISVGAFYSARLSQADYGIADLGRILLDPAPDGDYSLYSWDLLPSVLVFDFRDYATQDRYLKRLAFFVEKIGYRGTLARDEDIAVLHGWNAHDYGAEDLAAFFEAARSRSFPLGQAEKDLERLLLDAGILVESQGSILSGKGAIISIARESSDALRRTFAVHESTHAIFFADPEYRSFARSLWSSIGSEEKWFWKTYFAWAGYDIGSDYLMANEFQAYLLQQALSADEEYFTKRKPAELLDKHPELKERIDAYMTRYGPSFARRAEQLEAWLDKRYGILAGTTIFMGGKK